MRSRRWVLWLGFCALLATAGSAQAASSSRVAGGSTYWFYNCAGDQTMYIAVKGADHKVRNVATLQPNEHAYLTLDKGDLVSWRCGAPVTSTSYFTYATVTGR